MGHLRPFARLVVGLERRQRGSATHRLYTCTSVQTPLAVRAAGAWDLSPTLHQDWD